MTTTTPAPPAPPESERLQRYSWRALGSLDAATGTRPVIEGKLRASSREAVRAELQSRGLIPQSIVLEASRGIKADIDINLRKRPKVAALAEATRQMATMIESGSKLPETLEAVKDSANDRPLRDALAIVRANVNQGMTFSDALEQHPLVFPPLMVNMVRASEDGGFLEKGLSRVADNLESEVEIRGKVKAALTYPVVLAVITVIVSVFLITFLVPLFKELYADISDGTAQLPFITRMVVGVSENMTIIGPVSVVLLIAGFLWYRSNKNEPKVRAVIDQAKLKVPILKSLFQKASLSRFSHNLSSMLSAGVPISQALEVVAGTVGNYHVERSVISARESLAQGRRISEPFLDRPDLFPPFITKMIRTGEDSGKLPEMLDHVAQSCDRDVKNMTDAMSSLLEPLMLLVLGGIVGTLIVALYMPVFTMGELLQT